MNTKFETDASDIIIYIIEALCCSDNTQEQEDLGLGSQSTVRSLEQYKLDIPDVLT